MFPVDCSYCGRPKRVPPCFNFIHCTICQAITHISDPRRAPRGPLPRCYGSKRAFICGISYKGTDRELEGCIDDAVCMRRLLIDKFNFKESSILTLTDRDGTDPLYKPTNRNMIDAMKWLVYGCQPGDSLVFYFAGHGSQQKEEERGDERDGLDETILPSDIEKPIVDNTINAILVRPLPRGAKLHAIVDSCKSGTVLDLPFLCKMNSRGMYFWDDHRPRTRKWKGTNGGEAFSFSGCDDHQFSEETRPPLPNHGSMTYAFLHAIEHGHDHTYGSMLHEMRSIVSKINANGQDRCPLTSLLKMLEERRPCTRRDMRQTPQLAASETFDVHSKPFRL